MAGVTAHGATFSFGAFSGSVVGVSVETPTAEITDMSGITHAKEACLLVPTGAWQGGSITVDFLYGGSGNPVLLVRSVGTVAFASPGYSFSFRAIVESVSLDAKAGELVRGTMRFRLTDYMGV
jgi:hypothetical protein